MIQGDLDLGHVTNVASATNGAVTGLTDTLTITATQAPALTIDKSASPPTYGAIGAVIAYTYVVTNSGNVTLTGPFTVTDDKATATCPATASLAPGVFITCGASYTIAPPDLDSGSVTNVASAHGSFAAAPLSSATDSATVTAAQGPALTVDKSAVPSTYGAVGDAIAYSYLVTNSGNVTLTGPFTVSDDKTTVTCPATASLASGGSITCTATYMVSQADLDAGSVTNIASATNRSVTSTTDSATVSAVQSPALAIDKTSPDTSYAAPGDVLHYSYLVTNSGNVTLTGPFTISDDKATDESCPVTASLAPVPPSAAPRPTPSARPTSISATSPISPRRPPGRPPRRPTP